MMMNPASINVSAPTFIQPIYYPVGASNASFTMTSSGSQQPFVTSNAPWSGQFSSIPSMPAAYCPPGASSAGSMGGDLNQILPLILIMSQLKNGGGSSSDSLKTLLPLLLLSGGGFGGGASSATGGASGSSSGALMAILMQKLMSKSDASHKAEINNLKEEYEQKIDDINAQHQDDIKSLLAKHKAAIADLTKQQNDEIDELNAKHNKELTALANASAADRQALVDKQKQELDDLKNSQKTALDTLKSQQQAEINKVLNSAIKTVSGSVTESLDNNYFTDAQLQALTNNPQAHWDEIREAHDGKSNLVSNTRYDLTSLRTEFPDLKNVLPASKYSSSHPNKNYLLGEAQSSLDIANKLRQFKSENGITNNSELDGLINRLVTRSRNYIKATNNLGSPIALDLNGDGKIGTRSQDQGVKFDLDGNGSKEQISWLDGNDGFLVMDRNNNGVVDSGKELFGDQNGAANGFDELKKLDSNNDGKIDASDSAFKTLKVWQDANGDGVSQASELKTLSAAGVTEISLAYSDANRFLDDNGVDQREQSTFKTANGTGLAVDVWFEAGM